MGLHKIFKIVALLLGLAGVVFWFLLVSKGDEYVKMTGEGVTPMLYTGYIIMAIVGDGSAIRCIRSFGR